MLIPEPVPGLVVRYSYLWRREYLQGLEEGQKDRPCALVAAIRTERGETRVLALPITHAAPDKETVAIEIPRAVKERLGLDEARSWIVVSEYNEFVWPGPDLRSAPGSADGSVAYGMLPPGLFNAVRRALLEIASGGRSMAVKRTE